MTALAFICIVVAFFAGVAFGWIARRPRNLISRGKISDIPDAVAMKAITRSVADQEIPYQAGKRLYLKMAELRDELDQGEGYGRGRDDA